jgi:hypothetical protein
MAVADIVRGSNEHALWSTMALHEIRQRYRRSVLGPFWITISMGVMVFALGLLYGKIFQLELRDYIPYLSSGFVIWGLILASSLMELGPSRPARTSFGNSPRLSQFTHIAPFGSTSSLLHTTFGSMHWLRSGLMSRPVGRLCGAYLASSFSRSTVYG